MKSARIREFATGFHDGRGMTLQVFHEIMLASAGRPFPRKETHFIAGQSTLRKESINCSSKGSYVTRHSYKARETRREKKYRPYSVMRINEINRNPQNRNLRKRDIN